MLVETSDGHLILLLSRIELEALAGSPERLVDTIVQQVSRRGLSW